MSEVNNTNFNPENTNQEETKKDVQNKKPEVNESMIPKHRFDEINNKYKELKSMLDNHESEKAEAEKKALEEQKKFEELYKSTSQEFETFKKTASTYEDQAKQYESIVNEMVESKMKNIPEEMHELIPEGMSVQQKLQWLNKAEEKGLFKKKEVPLEIGKPMNREQKAPDINSLSPQQMLLSAYNSIMKRK